MVTDKQLESFDSSCLVVSTQHYNLFNINCNVDPPYTPKTDGMDAPCPTAS